MLQIIHFGFITICATCSFTFFEYSFLQSTPGKLLFHLKVVNNNGRACSFKTLSIRNSIKIFTILYMFMFFLHFEEINNYLLMALFLSVSTNAIWHDFMTITGGEKHAHKLVHDQVANTFVVSI